jgi:hypothetical protein
MQLYIALDINKDKHSAQLSNHALSYSVKVGIYIAELNFTWSVKHTLHKAYLERAHAA